jgi:hypothetical protein
VFDNHKDEVHQFKADTLHKMTKQEEDTYVHGGGDRMLKRRGSFDIR